MISPTTRDLLKKFFPYDSIKSIEDVSDLTASLPNTLYYTAFFASLVTLGLLVFPYNSSSPFLNMIPSLIVAGGGLGIGGFLDYRQHWPFSPFLKNLSQSFLYRFFLKKNLPREQLEQNASSVSLTDIQSLQEAVDEFIKNRRRLGNWVMEDINNLRNSDTIEEEFFSYLINHRKNKLLITLDKLGADRQDVPLSALEEEEASKSTGINQNSTKSLQWLAALALSSTPSVQASPLAATDAYKSILENSKKWRKKI